MRTDQNGANVTGVDVAATKAGTALRAVRLGAAAIPGSGRQAPCMPPPPDLSEKGPCHRW